MTLRPSLAVVALCACSREATVAPAAVDAAPPPKIAEPMSTTVVILGDVTAIEPMGSHRGTVLVVDLDPRFVATVRVASIVSGEPPWPKGSDPAFAIHSPSRTFMTSDPPRGRYELRLVRADERWTLTATPKP